MSKTCSNVASNDQSNPKIRMILLFSLGIPLSSWQKSGLAHRERTYYQRFTQDQHEVSLFTYGKDDQQFADFWQPIRILPWLGKITHFVKYACVAPFYHRRAFANANIVKSNQSQGSLVAVVAKLINPKLKFILRCGWVRTKEMIVAEENRTGLRFKRAVFTEWLGFKMADRIIVVTQSDADYIVERYHANRNKIHILPNSIDTNQYTFKQQSPDFTKEINILLVGRLTPMKNFQLAFQAIANLDKPITINIVGDGDYLSELQQLSQNLNLTVNFLGNVANDELATIYQQHDLVILPEAYGSGMPKVILETMASGVIILGSNTRSAQQLLRHQQNGFICQPSVSDIQDKLQLIFDTPVQELDQIRTTARNDIEQNFSMDACVNSEISLYQSLLRN